MSKTKFVLNSAGVQEIMKSPEMVGILSKHAKDIQVRCGDGYETDTYIGKARANASVGAKTWKAKRDNNKNNTLLKAIK